MCHTQQFSRSEDIPAHCVSLVAKLSTSKQDSDSRNFVFVVAVVRVTVPTQLLLQIYSLPNSQQALTFAIDLYTGDLEALTITASLL